MNQNARNAADTVIAVLFDRAGFDGWWGGIDDETSDEIMNALAESLLPYVKSE